MSDSLRVFEAALRNKESNKTLLRDLRTLIRKWNDAVLAISKEDSKTFVEDIRKVLTRYKGEVATAMFVEAAYAERLSFNELVNLAQKLTV